MEKKSESNAEANVASEKDLTFDLDLYDEYPGELSSTKYNESAMLIHAVEHYGTLNDSTDMHKEIVKKLFAIKICRASAIQSYSWQNYFHGKDVFIVSPEKTGKTWCYLPILCNLVYKARKNHSKSQPLGPLAIIIVKCLDKLIIVSNICNYFLEDVNVRVCTLTTLENLQKLNNCDVIVTMVGNLCHLLHNSKKAEEFNLARLKYLIFDDIDELEKQTDVKYENPLCAVLSSLYERLPKTAHEKMKVQVAVTATVYSALVGNLCLLLARNPLLLIRDPFEAAIYGNTEIVIRQCYRLEKMKMIIQFIKKHPLDKEALIIICESDEDAQYVADQLRPNGFVCLVAHSKTPKEWREKIMNRNLRPNHLQIRIFTDDMLNKLQIRNADVGIHFSLCQNWHKFTLRFAAFLYKHENLIKKEFAENLPKNSTPSVKRNSASCLILLDRDMDLNQPHFDIYLRRLKNFLPKNEEIVKSNNDRVEASILNLAQLNCNEDDSWCELPLRKLVVIRSESIARSNWKDIFAQIIPQTKSNKFEQLSEMIDEHINTLKKSEFFSKEFKRKFLAQLLVGRNVIVKHNGRYFRAKLHSMQCSNDISYYWFFLCDEATFKFVYDKKLFEDFLYPTSKRIVEFMPFQNIYCKLIGIDVMSLSKWFKCAGKLYAYAIRSRLSMPLVRNLGIKCYEILLFEERRTDTSMKFRLINKKLLNVGAASLHMVSGRHLDINIENIFSTMAGNGEN